MLIVRTRNGVRGVVISTMPEPNPRDFFANVGITGYEKAMENWRQHLKDLPLIPLPEELSHLKDGDEVKGWRVDYQVDDVFAQGWFSVTKEDYDKHDAASYSHRIILVREDLASEDVGPNGDKIIRIYKFQLEAIAKALRVVANTSARHGLETCMDRMVSQAEQFAKNALAGDMDKEARYGQKPKQ